ncbi:uncharacterized protein LOC116298301 [Actinia tenebrosa]|uniref:Uncharacterized protein LOC116298301 n=1 Tax=Actinia tenebrosa TaxID=6105 RepID=A0A6P8I501_ACTTE|nr:uncharacterized protein LOC116298301 [Actinia tenebrosa]
MMSRTLLLSALVCMIYWSDFAVASPKCPQPKLRKWHRVTNAMIKSTYNLGVRMTHNDVGGKLVITGNVYSNGCGGGAGSIAVTYIRGDWVQIRYTQEFRGSASCWKIFGTTAYPKYSSNIAFHPNPLQQKPVVALQDYSEADGDGIFNELHMNSLTNNKFDGRVYRCDNNRDNFWHTNNGDGLRRATVMLRRRSLTENAGIVTETSCGTPSYVIKDVYVLM